jgi:signal transduction histidine kinase
MTEALSTAANLKRGMGLSARLLLLTLAFVMLAEVLIFVPSIANFRNNWLNDKLASARTAALVLEAAPDDALPEALVKELLKNVGAETIALRIKGTRRLLAFNDMPPPISAMFDLRNNTAFRTITESFDTLFNGGNRSIGIIGDAPMGGDFVEIVIAETPLRDAMLRFAQNILALSLFISGVTGTLVFLALKRMIVHPVERLTKSITRFAELPEDQTRQIKPSGRTDEIGTAETAVAGMQQVVFQQLKQKEHLAALGLAVSKINHDLRNMLSSAQLISDRLGAVNDPTVQRFAPKLVQTLDRAIAFCQSTLAYGRAEERPPKLALFDLNAAMEEVADAIGLSVDHPVSWENRIPVQMMVVSDAEHLFRACTNLCRNALQAMEGTPLKNGNTHVLSVKSEIVPTGWQLDITDTGPGIPAAVRQKLFDAFHGSSRPGGTGLGLAIAADLIRAQGGTISLVDQTAGTCFRILLPRALNESDHKTS